MQTVELTDVYKASAEVTSLGSSDRVLVADSNGVQKRITREKLIGGEVNFLLKDAGWFRIMSYNVAGDALICISNGWSAMKGNYVFFAALMHASEQNNKVQPIVNICNDAYTPSFTKARVVYKAASPGWLDVYFPGSNANQIVKVVVLTSRNCTLLDGTSSADVPEGYSTKEISLLVGGGSKRLPFNKLRNLAERRVA